MCIVYELDVWSRYLNTKFILGSYLFGAVKLTKSTKHDKYRYSWNGIGFDLHSNFSINGKWGKGVIIFGKENI